MLARHAAEEVAAREAREAEGAWLTVWPGPRSWPRGGKWAARHGVVFGGVSGGFAFASDAARRRMEARMARRGRAAAAARAAAGSATKMGKAAKAARAAKARGE